MTDTSPQIENGFSPIANELMDAFYKLDISGMNWRILILILRNTYGYNRKVWETSNIEISKLLKTSRNRIHENIKMLIERKILFVTENRYKRRITIGIQKKYNRWVSSPKTGTVTENRYESSPKTGTVPLKTKTKEIIVNSYEKNGVPYLEIVRMWNEVLGETLPEVNEKLLTEKRKSAMAARWNTSEKTRSVDWWREFFNENIITSDFLMGKVKPRPGHKQFKATFDWVFKLENFVKIVEGNYE